MDLMRRERKTCGVPFIHCDGWVLKREDTCCDFRTKDGLLKEIATLLYTLVAISIL